ncbi:MAG: hypothetical protein J6T01_03715 [Kiritimatiellae bacterium]|nr:hypothetical protein [Kiritimatiellia bacterium]
MNGWGWLPGRNLGIWRCGAAWLRPVAAAAPYLTVGLLLLMMHFVGGALTSFKGVLFDLPDGGVVDGESADMVALMMPVPHETMVFFDDTRYLLGDAASMRSLREALAESAGRSRRKSLLVLADRRIPAGGVLELVAAARKSGIRKVLVAGKGEGGGE